MQGTFDEAIWRTIEHRIRHRVCGVSCHGCGLGAVANLLESGLVLEHALQSASHHLSNVAAAAWADIFLY